MAGKKTAAAGKKRAKKGRPLSLPVIAKKGRKKIAEGSNWYIVICSSAADSVTLQAGASKDDNSVYAQWKQGEGTRGYPIPDRYQGLDSIYVQLTIPDSGGQTEACVGYQGYAKKAIHMNSGGEEDHQVSKDDSENDCACR
jgi:hypothetical protein